MTTRKVAFYAGVFILVAIYSAYAIFIEGRNSSLISSFDSILKLVTAPSTSNASDDAVVDETSDVVANHQRPPRVFCMIKSYLANYRNQKIQTVMKLWGSRCDDYRVIMLVPEELRPNGWRLGKQCEILEPFKILQPETLVREDHGDITRKIYHSMKYVYQNFPDFQWYYLVDDDSFVNYDNLKTFLRTKNHTELVTYGYDFSVFINKHLKPRLDRI